MRPEIVEADRRIGRILPTFAREQQPLTRWSPKFRILKYAFDKGTAVAALPLIGVLATGLFVLNPIVNPGPVFFRQERMGLGRRPFRMWKFRTMAPAPERVRSHDAPVEDHRISAFGGLLRKYRIDELPNFINVLRGDMSVIGPRPDAYEHAMHFIDTVPYYQDRFRVRPGITGLAQVQGGYADNTRAVQRKARFDRFYVKRSRGKLDLYIIRRTVRVMATGFGAK